MKRSSFLSVALALACGCAFAAEPFPEIDIPYERFVLPNGLTLIVHEDHKAPLVAVNVVYKVGSRDERPGRSGFAHLFEHLMFNGSEHYDDEFFKALAPVGGAGINGTTTADRTTYYETVPASALDLTLWLESDRMGHLLGAIDQEKLDEQRGVVQNEKRQGENQPLGTLGEILAQNAYPPGHPYSWTPIGSMQDLDAATLEDVKEWFRDRYGAANAVLTIAGDVRAADVRARVERYFGHIPGRPAARRLSAWPAPMRGVKRLDLQEAVPQPEIHKVWNVAALGSRDLTLLQLAAGVLESGRQGGRLYQRLVRDEETTTEATSDLIQREMGSQFHLTAVVKPGVDVERVERTIDEELAALLRDGPTSAELETLKMEHYGAYARIEGVAGKASLLSGGEVVAGSPAHYKRTIGWLREATPEAVRDAARRWLADGALVLNIRPEQQLRTADQDVDRASPPTVGALPALQLPPLRRMTLSNGLKVALAERHSAPVIQMTLIADGGFAADGAAEAGTAAMTMGLLDKGTQGRDRDAIVAQSRKLQASLYAGTDLDSAYVTLNALSARLDPSVELFAEILSRPSFPQRELEQLRAQALAAVEQEKVQPGALAKGLMPRLLFGEDHPYGHSGSGVGTREAIVGFCRESAQAFHRKWLRPDNATLLVVGDVTMEKLAPLLERHMRGWRAPAEPLPRKLVQTVARRAAAVHLIDRKGAEQSYILAANLAPSRSDADYAALRAANAVLGGDFLARLNMNLREGKNWSYGVSSRWQQNKGPGAFVVAAPVQTDRTAAAMREIAAELRSLTGDKPPSAVELETARNAMVLRLPAGAETVSGVMSFYSPIITYGLAEDHWSEFSRRANALTSAEVQAAARKLISPDALTWIVVGDLEKIEGEVRALGLGEVGVLDADGKRVASP